MAAVSNEIKDSHAISDQVVQQYQEDGAICLRGVVGADWIERLKEATEVILQARGQNLNNKGASGNFRGDLDMWLRNEGFRDFALHGPTGDIAKRMMRSNAVQLFSDQLFVKEPGTSTPSPWHHDQTYWPVLGDQVCSIWVAMDPVSRETSGLEYVRGSHRWGRRFKVQAFGDRSLPGLDVPSNEDIPDFNANRHQYQFLSWDLEPGDVLVHHSLTVHGAGGNLSQTRRRRAVATRWFGDDATFRPVSLYSEDMTGLRAGEPMSNSKLLFPPVPFPAGRAIPPDYWESRK
jgi:ectoine hydroxylase-related dioxygenase (phytanoyl-CoA dioxygenase family)